MAYITGNVDKRSNKEATDTESEGKIETTLDDKTEPLSGILQFQSA